MQQHELSSNKMALITSDRGKGDDCRQGRGDGRTGGSAGRAGAGDAPVALVRDCVPQSEVIRAIVLEGSPCCELAMAAAEVASWSKRAGTSHVNARRS